MLIIRAVALSLTLMLSGCQYFDVQSSQLSSIKNAFFPSPKQLPDSRWSVLFGGYSAVVQPVSVEKSTLFVNGVDTVSFNGWVVTKVSGLDGFTPAWEIKDSGNERAFVVNGRVVAKHQCAPWLKYDAEAGVRFEQDCVGKQAYTNTILVDSLGQITDIQQVVDSSFMVLRLRLNN
jgi:hypothetical protein